MTKNYIEKEIKLKIKNADELKKKLKDAKAKFLGKAFQRTIRVDTPKKDLEKNGIFLRVRSGFQNNLTLKIKNQNNKNVFARQEVEIKINNIKKAAKALATIGFTKQLIMEKYRSEWKYDGAIISIDKMPFGDYMEIEGDEGKIYKIVKKLGLDIRKKITISYWGIFAKYKKKYNLKNDNIVFQTKNK